MSEHITVAPPEQQEVKPLTQELVVKQTETFSESLGIVDATKVGPEEEAVQKSTALRAAKEKVDEAQETKRIEDLVDSLDFSPEKYNFVAMDNYSAPAKTGQYSTISEGKGNMSPRGQYRERHPDPAKESKWGDPRQEAHHRQPVEKVGVRVTTSQIWGETQKRLPSPGWKGKLGFKKLQTVPELKQVEPTYIFDYEFAAPSHSDDQAAVDAGNRTGQNIRLSLELTKEQAEDMSKILTADPKAARTVLDKFAAATNGNGMWEAEIFDQEGKFHDPGERYGEDFVARGVRPRYEAVPDLEPEVVGLIEPTK